VNVLHRRILLVSLKIGDLALATLSYGLAAFLLVSVEHGPSFSGFLSLRIKLANFIVFGVALLGWHLIYLLCRLYESKRLVTAKKAMFEQMQATALAALCLLILAVVFKITMVTAPFVVLFWVINTFALLASRLLLRQALGHVRRHGRNLRCTVILGTNQRARKFAQRLARKPEWGYRSLGFIDEPWHGLADFHRTGHALLCDFSGLPDFLRRNIVDEVAIYLPLRSYHARASEIAALCAQQGITVRYDADVFGTLPATNSTETFDADPYFTNHYEGFDGWARVFKRLFDIVGSVVLIVLLSPILAIAALLIKWTSMGPVFFSQERIGINKRRFRIWKFRTMVTNAESLMPQLEKQNEVSGPVFKIKDDPRITRIGKFLRRSSIDELPQLFNVVMGDMSLVGPRPLPVRDFEGFSEDWQRRRFSVRPGITCLWQIRGRSEIGFEQWMALDLQYLDEWSLWLDVKILALTIPAVVKGSGAA
jgi:exopolysaccharide biosynthesis polyprenyl glycosylphosphotransferase